MTTPPTPTSAAEPREPLWTDERITEWLDDHWLGVGSAEAMGAEMRHDYEAERRGLQARIDQLAAALVVEQAQTAELQSQLDAARAGQWTPVENGIYHTDGPEIIYVKGALLNFLGETYVYLQQGYALCRLQPASNGSEGTVQDGIR